MAGIGKKIVVVGSINMDLVSRVPNFPKPGETVRGISFDTHPGGKGANQAVAVARLAHPVQMIGMVGNDVFGSQLRDGMLDEGVDVTHVAVADDPTGTATILVDENGENTIVVCAGANASVSAKFLESKKEVIASAGLVLAQLEIPFEAIQQLALICERAGVPLMLDPAPAAPIPDEVLKRTTWITPNETEAAFYVKSTADPAACVAALHDLGPANVLLKRGAAGSTISVGGGNPIDVPARTVRSIDTTAAGDSFNAAFAVALMGGMTPQRSAEYASAAAAICVTRLGAQPSLASRGEVDEMLLDQLSTVSER